MDDLKAQVQKAIREAAEVCDREWRQALIGLFAVTLSGCAQHAVDAVKEMRSLACAGDSASFFSHVDRKEVVASAIHDAEEKTEAAVQRVDPLQQATFRAGANDRIKTGFPKIFEDAFRDWEDDIKHGPESDLCRMSVMDGSEVDNSADVHWRTPTGKDRRWRMARFGKRWVLVGIDD